MRIYKNQIQLYQKNNDFDRLALAKSNIAVFYYYQGNLKQASKELQDALQLMRDSERRNEYRSALNIKILGNLSIVYLTLGKVESCKTYHD